MREILRRDLTVALKARDRAAVAALRSLLAAIDNAEAPPVETTPAGRATSEHVAGAVAGLGAAEVARRALTDAGVRGVVEREISERVTAAADYTRAGRRDLSDAADAEVVVLQRYLIG